MARSFSFRLALLLSLAGVAAGCSASASSNRGDLAVTRVVLYQNGVGYFERTGEVSGKTLQLQIRPDQINDMLTSLTVIDRGGKSVASISLPVEKSSTMLLGELPDQVRNAGGLLAVLDAFRGARVGIAYDRGSTTGRVVGVERTSVSDGDSWRVTLMTDDAELIPIDVDKIRKVELDDVTLSVGLDRALDVALGEGDWKPVELAVHFPDDGAHDIVMSYVVAMPTWKPAYRIIFGDDDAVRLQGWAVVDNVSGEDWDDVKLSLTAGAPISFIVDLHTPRMPQRPDLTGRTYTAHAEAPPEAVGGFVAPSAPMEEREMAAEAPRKRRKAEKKGSTASARADDWGDASGGDGGGAAWDQPSMDADLMMGSLESQASGERVGALFRYDVEVPVTVPDGSSALVTIVNADVEGEDVLLYDPSSGSSNAYVHPFRSVRLANTTGFVLEKGPVTIYKQGTFVGEGLTNQVGTDESVFVPYALESGIHVEQAWSTGSQAQKLVKIKDGVATIESSALQKITYTVTNNLGEIGTMYVRIDKMVGYELREPATAITQGEIYFVPIELDGATQIEQTIVQATKSQRTLALLDPDFKTVVELYISDADADPAVRDMLEAVLALRSDIGDLDHRQDTIETRQQQLRDRARDLRSNIKVLGNSASNASLKKELVKKLGGVEEELAGIDAELVTLGEERYALEVRMREAFQEITLER